MTDKEKEDIVKKHINPEIAIFNECFGRLKRGLSGDDKRITEECFLLHARNFYYFFIGPKRYPEDVFANDILNSGWTKINMRDFPIKEINRQLVHFSWSRLGSEQKELSVEIDEIYSLIKQGIVEFNSKVLDENYKFLELAENK